MKRVLLLIFLLVAEGFKPAWSGENQNKTEAFDVVVYGATPSGIAAAINAAQYGHTVALIEEHNQGFCGHKCYPTRKPISMI
jgi:NADPH-dependent 2,4-dienoyl-CoA reductase/sulfur reductase-like enzyme